MGETGYVYTLNDPDTGAPKYVGATQEPRQRLKQHEWGSSNGDIKEWVRSLESEGKSPEMSIVRVAPLDELRNAEREMIEQLAEEWELFNRQDWGGYYSEGVAGSDDRRNIKVQPETFTMLKDDKPDGVTWDYYLRRLAGCDSP